MIAEPPQFIVPQEITDLIRSAAVENLIEERALSKEWQQVNQIDRTLAEMPQQEMPLFHVFTPGLYTRSIFMPAGSFLTSRIHIFEHPFVISAGIVSVWCDEKGWEVLRASHIGVTKAGTRRILYIHEDTIWTTFHVTDETDPDKIVDSMSLEPSVLGHMNDVPIEKMEIIRSGAKVKGFLT